MVELSVDHAVSCPVFTLAHTHLRAVEQVDLVQSSTLAQFHDLRHADAAWSGLCWNASCPHASHGAFAYRACAPLLVSGRCRSRCGHGCFPNGCAHPGGCRRWQDDRGSFLCKSSGRGPVPFPWSSPLSAASRGSKLMIYWWLLISSGLGVLVVLAVCQQTGRCKREIAALKGVEHVRFPQLRSALFIQKLLAGKFIVLVNEVRLQMAE